MKKVFLSVLLLLASTIILQAQEYYYYYNGEKISLEVDPSTIALMVEGNDGVTPETIKATLLKDSRETITIKEDHTRRLLEPMDDLTRTRRNLITYYAEIKTLQLRSKEEYDQQLERYNAMPGVIKASPCFKSEDGTTLGLSNNFYVKLNREEDVELLYETARKHDLEILGSNKFMPLWFTVACRKETRSHAIVKANELYESGLFNFVEPEFINVIALASDDPLFNQQWGLKNTGQDLGPDFPHGVAGIDIKAEQAWKISKGENIVLAIFDVGYEVNHPDLEANNEGEGYDVMTGSFSHAYYPHGTAIAGIAGAVQDNQLGISGVAPKVKLVCVSFDLTATPEQLGDGINWAVENGANIINNSWGFKEKISSSILEDAINNALVKNTVLVFAAGNENSAVNYPANIRPEILTVGSIKPDGYRVTKSNHGAELDVVAPGLGIPTTDMQGMYGYNNTDYVVTSSGGTSFAAPHVAGVAALVLGANPYLNVQQVNYVIEQTTQKINANLYTYSNTPDHSHGAWNEEMGYGLVDAYKASLLASGKNCNENIYIGGTLIAPTVKYEIANTITSTLVIKQGGRSDLLGSQFVELIPGFSAEYGSQFQSYIQPCIIPDFPVINSMNERKTYQQNNIDYTEASSENITDLSAMPNPFNNSLTLNFALSTAQIVSINLVDITGRVFIPIIKHQFTEAGAHTVNIETSTLTSGIYSVILTIGNNVTTRRVVKK